jgi:hypothetical protein
MYIGRNYWLVIVGIGFLVESGVTQSERGLLPTMPTSGMLSQDDVPSN